MWEPIGRTLATLVPTLLPVDRYVSLPATIAGSLLVPLAMLSLAMDFWVAWKEGVDAAWLPRSRSGWLSGPLLPASWPRPAWPARPARTRFLPNIAGGDATRAICSPGRDQRPETNWLADLMIGAGTVPPSIAGGDIRQERDARTRPRSPTPRPAAAAPCARRALRPPRGCRCYLSASVRRAVSWSHSTRNASWPLVERISR